MADAPRAVSTDELLAAAGITVTEEGKARAKARLDAVAALPPEYWAALRAQIGMPPKSAAVDRGKSAGSGERWYAHPNDLTGGWSILTYDGPPSNLDGTNGREVAGGLNEVDARWIVALHNSARRTGRT